MNFRRKILLYQILGAHRLQIYANPLQTSQFYTKFLNTTAIIFQIPRMETVVTACCKYFTRKGQKMKSQLFVILF